MAHVSDFKKKVVKELEDLFKQYPIIGVVNMENLPAPQLQSMKSELRDKVQLYMTKKRLIKIAIENTKNDKKNIEVLIDHLEGMPAILFTKDSPFKLSRILQKSKTSAPAKAGQIAPNDITVPAGPTSFAPGPVISELSAAGLDVGVENGKVAVKSASVVAKKGEKITQKVAEVLTRLDIKPMHVGLDLVAAYEDGTIYTRDVLFIDEKEYSDNINLAALQAFNLAFNAVYITKNNASLLISKAFNDAKGLGLSQDIIDEGIINDLLGKAERSMLNLKGTANIVSVEKPEEKVEEKKEEIKAEEAPKEQQSEQPKEQAKEQSKPKEEKPQQAKEEQLQESKKESQSTEKPKEEKPQQAKEEQQQEEKPKEQAKEQSKPKEETSPEQAKKEGSKQGKSPKQSQSAPKDALDKKIDAMVEQTKNRNKTAQDIVDEVKEEQKKEEPEKPKQVDEVKEIENLTKELIQKGTLRK